MNWDQIQGQWRQFTGEIKKRWGKLTDDDLDQVRGDRDKLVGKIQEKYGRTREDIQRELDDFCYECEPGGTTRGTRWS